jgi:hypothetical protein
MRTAAEPGSAENTTWYKITELQVAAKTGCEQTVMEMAGAALSTLHLSDTLVRQIKTGIGNTLARYYEIQPELLILVRVFISAKAVPIQADEKVQATADAPHTVDRNLGSRRTGWGFFLIEKQLGEARTDLAAQQSLEIFCYQEGK